MTIINAATIDAMFRGFKTLYSASYAQAPSQAAKIAMTVTTSPKTYTTLRDSIKGTAELIVTPFLGA